MLFLMAAGLTLIFGIMNVINLAHGSLYMLGAYAAAAASQLDRLVPARRCWRPCRPRVAVGIVLEIGHLAHAVPARPSRSGAGDLRPDPVLQRAGAHRLGLDRALMRACRRCSPARVELLPGTPYPVYRLAIIAVGLARRAVSVCADRAHPARHADPRRRRRTGSCSARSGSTSRLLYTFVFGLGAALAGARRGDGRADLHGAVRDGRERPDLGLCRDRDRRHRLDPRRASSRALLVGIVDAMGRAFLRPLLGADHERRRGGQRRPGARLDADLYADGGGPVRRARRACSRRGCDEARRLRPRSARGIGAASSRWRWCRRSPRRSASRSTSDLFARVMIFAIAALSLDFILGYGGLRQLRPCRLSRHRRLRGRHPGVLRRRRTDLAALCRRDRRLGAGRAARRSAPCRCAPRASTSS